MGLEPSRVPGTFPRNDMEKTMLLVYILRRGQNSPGDAQRYLQGLAGYKLMLKNEVFNRRIDAAELEFAARQAA